jgi:diguanylate cyclase (GGDEF)-like protein
MNEERSQVTDFIAEIGKGLIEMETSFVASLSHASQAHRSNVDFNNLLEGQMEDVKRSTHIGKTLSEIRDFVSSRLTSIKAALENKRQEDERRMEEINNEMGTLQQNLQSVRKEIEQVQQQRTHLQRETFLDPLTRIPNRRAYDLRIKEELQRYHRYKHSFSLLLFDVDHFKKVNDNYGHWAGDKCLKEAIKRIKPVMRESDFLARYGGEEFTIILPGTDKESARAVAERLRVMIEKTHFMFQGQKIPLTISVGVAQIEPSDINQQVLFSRVDAAMYLAKRSGRNQVVLA